MEQNLKVPRRTLDVPNDHGGIQFLGTERNRVRKVELVVPGRARSLRKHAV